MAMENQNMEELVGMEETRGILLPGDSAVQSMDMWEVSLVVKPHLL